jgi:hypothetical protein
MKGHRWIVAGLGIATLLLFVPGLAAAGSEGRSQIAAPRAASGVRASTSPRMLANNSTTDFRRRPATVTPFGNGVGVDTIIGRRPGTTGKPIRWQKWGRTTASGRGIMWRNDGIPDIASGHWKGHPVTLYAYRVIKGRYTRLTLRGTENGQAQTWRLGLIKLSYIPYAWRTLVRVPSWKDFPSSYTGDDWAATLEAMKAAIEAGFEKAGLSAVVQFGDAWSEGENASQSPKAGSSVPEETTVHIRIPVYD